MLQVVVIVQMKMEELVSLFIIFHLLSLLVKGLFPIAHDIGQLQLLQVEEFPMPIPGRGDQDMLPCVSLCENS